MQFLYCLRPNFSKQLPSQGRKWLAGKGVRILYGEAQDCVDEAIDKVPGKLTLCVDGHVDGRGRKVGVQPSTPCCLHRWDKGRVALQGLEVRTKWGLGLSPKP